jgi:hypothetical protein
MYPITECLVIAGLAFVLAAGLFLVTSVVVLVDAALRTIAGCSRRSILATRRALETVWAHLPRRTPSGAVNASGLKGPHVTPKAAEGMFVD